MTQQNQSHFSIRTENIKPTLITLIKYQNESKCPLCKKQRDYSILLPAFRVMKTTVSSMQVFTIYRCYARFPKDHFVVSLYFILKASFNFNEHTVPSGFEVPETPTFQNPDILNNDMLVLRKCWCRMSLENSSPKDNCSHRTERANTLLNEGQESNKKLEALRSAGVRSLLLEETSASLLQHPAQGTDEQQHGILQHFTEAAKWCVENISVFRGHISFPALLSMDKDDTEEALQKYDLLSEFPEKEEREYVLIPFSILFFTYGRRASVFR